MWPEGHRAAVLVLVRLLLPQGLQEDPFHLAQGLVVHTEVLLLSPQGTAQGSLQHFILLLLDGQPGPRGERAQCGPSGHMCVRVYQGPCVWG